MSSGRDACDDAGIVGKRQERREGTKRSTVAQEVMESSSSGSESQQSQQGRAPGAARTQLVQRLMDSAANLPAFIHDLLTQQAIMVAGTEASAFLLERTAPDPQKPEAGPGVSLRPVAHIRPDNSAAETRAAALQ